MIAVRTTRVTLTTATSRALVSGMVWGVGFGVWGWGCGVGGVGLGV